MEKLVKKVIVRTQMEILTGIHIGGSKESVEIGGLDNSVIKLATKDNQPYIPGSSIKGKMRCLLEQIAGASRIGGGRGNYNEKPLEIRKIIDLFGFADDGKPSKLIVRDAYMDPEDLKKLRDNEYLDMPYTEIKTENNIDRVKGVAEAPRQMERIPAGVKFNVEFVINVWGVDENSNDFQASFDLLKKGIKALESDYLGGNGSRGYGQVKFSELKIEEVNFANYFANEN